jgi:3-methylcrotonyl-CoA carboxylase alpha subunit
VTGRIERFVPPSGEGIRLDTGVGTGSEVSIFYDSMLAKLIGYGPDRASAIARLSAALDDFEIDGLRTNIPLQSRILAEPAFRSGDTTTSFLSEHPEVAHEDDASVSRAAALVAIGAVVTDSRAWRIAGAGIPVRLQGPRHALTAVASRMADDRWHVTGDVSADVTFERAGARTIARTQTERFAGEARIHDRGVAVKIDGTTTRFTFAAPPDLERASRGGGGAGSDAVSAPMPGRVLKVAVEPGDAVSARDLLVVLEAMKMEHRIEALRDGVVKSVAVTAGALVAGGAPLVELEAILQESTVSP